MIKNYEKSKSPIKNLRVLYEVFTSSHIMTYEEGVTYACEFCVTFSYQRTATIPWLYPNFIFNFQVYTILQYPNFIFNVQVYATLPYL